MGTHVHYNLSEQQSFVFYLDFLLNNQVDEKIAGY